MSDFSVFQLSAADDAQVEAFLITQAVLNPHQYPVWGEFQRAVGSEFFRLGIKDAAGALVAYAQIFVRRLPLGIAWLHVPRGPIQGWGTICPLVRRGGEGRVIDLFFAEIKKLGEGKKAVFIRFDFPEDFNRNLIPKTYTLHPSHATNFPDATLVLDLTKTEAELLAEMKPKGRYNIRVAEKHGVTVRETADPVAAEVFSDLLQKTTARDGFSSHPKSYYMKFLEILGKQGKASCFLAEKANKPIAVSLVTFFGKVATYYYGASDHAYRNLMAPYLVQWAAISAAKARGCLTYDFLGIAPEEEKDHYLAGVTDFKRKFGGMIVKYPGSAELVLRPGIYRALKIAKKVLRRG